MNYINKGKAKNILAWSCLLLFILLTVRFSAFAYRGGIFTGVHAAGDTPPPVIKRTDSFHLPSIKEIKKPVVADTVFTATTDTFHFKGSKDSLNSPVVYHADDSMVIDVPAQKMYLYGKTSSVHYEDNNLSAPEIEYDQRLNIMSAYLKKDSTGKVISYPYYTQQDFKSISDTIRFNMKTGRGLTKGTYTKQGEMFIYGDKIKKADTSTFFALNTRFTTCNLDTPHFAFVAKKAIFINKKWAYTGPVHAEFEGVPIPIPLPFGIFPLSQGRHSGLLAPSFAANDQLGLSLENLGYYKIFSPNWDMVTKGTLYSYGSYTLNFNPRYYRRYHYQGNIGLSIQKIHPLDQASSQTYNIIWSHNADTKARPGVNFTANVNAGSSKFNSQVPNNGVINFQNQLSSSITYSKVWKNKPYNISISANHNQNTNQRLINLNVPDVAFNVNTLYPFRRKEPIGEYKWYENLGIAYNGSARSLTSFYDTAGQVFQQISRNLQYGAQHNVPISLSLPPLGVLQLAPTVSYQETWYQRRLVRSYDSALSKFDTVTIQKGFYTARQMSFSLSAATRIFGMFGFGKNSRIKAIRHEIRPSIGLNYSPNFNAHNYYLTKLDPQGTLGYLSYFDGSIYAPYSNQKFGGLNFNIDNNISMKVRNRKDTSATADKKVSLLDGLNISGGYNFLLDSFKFQDISVQAHTNLFNKVNLSANALFDPYQIDSRGVRINKTVWKKKPLSLGNLLQGNIALQTSFKGGDKSKKTAVQNLDPNALAPGVPLDEYQREAAYIQNNPSEFVDFSIPWSVDLSYSLLFTRRFDVVRAKFLTTLTQGVTFNSSVNLTEKWKIGMNGSFDITTRSIGQLSGYLSRDMHCWQMGINISPIGRFRSFSINISPKSPILRDLKINRTRSFLDL